MRRKVQRDYKERGGEGQGGDSRPSSPPSPFSPLLL